MSSMHESTGPYKITFQSGSDSSSSSPSAKSENSSGSMPDVVSTGTESQSFGPHDNLDGSSGDGPHGCPHGGPHDGSYEETLNAADIFRKFYDEHEAQEDGFDPADVIQKVFELHSKPGPHDFEDIQHKLTDIHNGWDAHEDDDQMTIEAHITMNDEQTKDRSDHEAYQEIQEMIEETLRFTNRDVNPLDHIEEVDTTKPLSNKNKQICDFLMKEKLIETAADAKRYKLSRGEKVIKCSVCTHRVEDIEASETCEDKIYKAKMNHLNKCRNGKRRHREIYYTRLAYNLDLKELTPRKFWPSEHNQKNRNVVSQQCWHGDEISRGNSGKKPRSKKPRTGKNLKFKTSKEIIGDSRRRLVGATARSSVGIVGVIAGFILLRALYKGFFVTKSLSIIPQYE